MTYEEVSVEDEVKCLPNIVNGNGSSNRVSKLNDRQITKHEIALSNYHDEMKSANDRIQKMLIAISKIALEKMNDKFIKINDVHIYAIELQENFSSVDPFYESWSMIEIEIKEILDVIHFMEEDSFRTVEHQRVEDIKAMMTFYFDEIKSNGIWDDTKLIKFFNNESMMFNKKLIENYRKFAMITANVKFSVVIKMLNYRKHWEKLLLSWRDFLVHKNLAAVKEIVQSDEFTKSREIKCCRAEVFLSFEKDDEAILDLYSSILKNLPYNQEKISSFSSQVTSFLERKEITKEKYLEKAKFHNDILIKKLDQKLSNIKQFLFKEASCKEELFSKTFARYTGDGSESYEMACKKCLAEDHLGLANNLRVMSNVHSTMMRFLYCICKVWSENNEKVKHLKETLFDGLKTCRVKDESEKKFLEFAIEKIVIKIPSVSCDVKLDKLLEKVKSYLQCIEKKSNEFYSELKELIVVYPKIYMDQIKGYESEMLKQIGLVKYDSISKDFMKFEIKSKTDFFTSLNGQRYDRLAVIPALCMPGINDNSSDYNASSMSNVYNICETLYISACKTIVDHIASNENNQKEILNSLVTKLTNEMHSEKKLRTIIHQPRLSMITEDFFNRKRELENFIESFEVFYESSIEFESQMTVIEEEFANDSNEVITNIEAKIEKALAKQLKTFKSKVLIGDHMKFESSFMDLEKKLSDLVKSYLSKIERFVKSMRTKEEKFSEYANNGHFEFAEKSKYFHEFSGVKERVKLASIQSKRTIKHIESSKSKKIVGIFQNYNTHYRHCLLDLYYLEMKSMLLAGMKTKIRSLSSYGEKDLTSARSLSSQIQEISSGLNNCQPKNLMNKVIQHKQDFIKVFNHLKNFINFLNYRCSDISLPAENSTVEMNKIYTKFVSCNASISDTIDFTKDIVQLVSNTATDQESFPRGSVKLDSSDKNWIANRSFVEKKFITGNLTSIYGVGANCFDVPNHPWANACATLVSNNSYWLNKNPDGMQALKDLQEKKQSAKTRNHKSFSSNAIPNNRIKEISSKIRKLILPKVNANLQEKRLKEKESENLPKNTLQSELLTDAECKNKQISSDVTLPAIKPSMKGVQNDLRNNSDHQLNLRKVMNLNKTVEYLTKEGNKKRRSTYFQQNHKLLIYDFLIMDEKELRKIVFEAAAFFKIPERKYIVDEVCERIFSIVEKVKCCLLHLQEDFIIACIIFYRQKHFSIKYSHLMNYNSDTEIDGFVSQLQLYLDYVEKDCEKKVSKVKDILNKLYNTFEVSSSKIYHNLYSEMSKSFIDLFDSHISTYNGILLENKCKKEKIVLCLKPNYCHPNHKGTLRNICENEKKNRINETLMSNFSFCMDKLDSHLHDFELKIKLITNNLLEVVENAVQIQDIRKMTSSQEEVKKLLRHNLAVTVNNDINSNSQGLLIKNEKQKSTKSRLMLSVIKERNSVISDFKKLYSSKANNFKDLHTSACAEEEDWIVMWQSSIKNLEGLINNEI